MSDQDARWVEAWALEDAGRREEAETIFREQAEAGHLSSMGALANLLTEDEGPRRLEGLAWYRRAARLGDGSAAWNCAMTWRMSDNRRRYHHWIARAAKLGYEEAAIVLAEIGRRRLAGRRWPMFKTTLSWIDPEDIADMLQAFLNEAVTAAEVRAWADGVACGELLATPELRERRRLKPILDELATGEITPARARELIFVADAE